MGFVNRLNCWVHFIVVELRAVFLFYLAVKSFTSKIATSAEMKRELVGPSGGQAWTAEAHCLKDGEVDDRLKCVKEGVQEALWQLWVSDETVPGCYRQGAPGFSYIGAMHLSALAVCALFVLVTFGMLAASCAPDWRSGQYLHFTWKLEHTTPYKVVAVLLLTYAVGCVVFVVLCSAGIVPSKHLFLNPYDLFELSWSDMLGLLGSSYALLQVHDPPFNWEDPRLLAETFVRSPLQLVHQSNDQFGALLDHAILQSRLGNMEEIEKLVGHTVVDPPFGLVAGFPALQLGLGDGSKLPTLVALRAIDEPQFAEPSAENFERRPAGCCGTTRPLLSA